MKICFISLKSYDLLAGSENPRFMGGAERQQVLAARGLQDLGHEVSFVTHDFGQEDGESLDGIRVYKAYHPGSGLPLIRAFTPRWSGLRSAMARADADVYHQMCADAETGQVAHWCHQNGRQLVFATASDADCIPGLPLLKTRRQRWLYRYGLSRANWVVCQTLSQRSNLKKHFGVDSKIVRSCTSSPQFDMESKRRPEGENLTLAWVGRLVPLKRLEWIFEFAEKVPSYQFLVVGGGDSSDPYVRGLFARAETLGNLTMLGRVSDEELWSVYERADLLLDTASVAGVPTTFLEAWAHGVPVVTTSDPDGNLENNNLGSVVSSVPEMIEAARELTIDLDRWTDSSKACRRYFEENHTVEAIARAYDGLLTESFGPETGNRTKQLPVLEDVSL